MVTIEEKGGTLLLSVHDNGRGITEDENPATTVVASTGDVDDASELARGALDTPRRRRDVLADFSSSVIPLPLSWTLRSNVALFLYRDIDSCGLCVAENIRKGLLKDPE